MAVVNFVLFNSAASGMISGIQAGRLSLVDASDEQVEPSDFSALVTAANLFATEVDAVLQTVVSPPANIALLVSGGSTHVPATAASANAAESLPPAMVAITKAAWEGGRTLPISPSTGLPFAQADYQPIANAVVSAFVEFCANTSNT